MKEYVEAFLSVSDYADSTKESYRYALMRLCDWLEERSLTFDDLTVERYLKFLNSHEWSNNMRRLYAAAVRVFLRWMGYDSSPILRLKLPRDNAAPGRVLDQVQLRDLLASFDTSKALGWRDLAMTALFADTGLRALEMCRLELGRVNMSTRRLQALVKRGRWQEKSFGEDTARFLSIWLELRPRYARAEVKALFVSTNGKTKGCAMTPGGLRKLFRKFGKQAGLDELSPHDLRRTMATLLIEAGAPTRLVQDLGGWEDIRIVERYTHQVHREQIDRYSAVSAIMRK
jgi:integrase/recombinase XerC